MISGKRDSWSTESIELTMRIQALDQTFQGYKKDKKPQTVLRYLEYLP